MALYAPLSQFHPTDVSPLTVLPVCRSANALTFLALIEISLEPSKPTPAIFRAVFSFVAVAALPDSSPERPPLNVCRLVQVFAVLSNGIFSPLVPSSRKPRFLRIASVSSERYFFPLLATIAV